MSRWGRWRRGRPRPATEDPLAATHLKMLYDIQMEGEPATVATLARALGVSPAPVECALGRLVHAGLVTPTQSGTFILTGDGQREAELALRRHRLAELYLVQRGDMDWVAAHQQAQVIEPALSTEAQARLVEQLGHPTTCPHGNPIPGQVADARAFLRERGAVRLAGAPLLRPLQVLAVSEVTSHPIEAVQRLDALGLRPGRGVTVVERPAPERGLVVELEGGRRAVVPADLAALVWAHPSPA